MDKSKEYIERSEVILGKVKELVSEAWPAFGIETIIVPFGQGARVCLIRAIGRGVYPIATACVNEFKFSTKDIVHGLWGVLKLRAKDEVQYLKKESKLKK
jgi:hypothetical protein